MKNEIENGVKNFIEAAFRDRDGLDPEDDLPVAVHAASGDETINETLPYIVAQVTESPHLVGGIGHARLMVVASSPHKTGYETDHQSNVRFLRAVFSAAVPPKLPVNAAHLSEEVWTASGDEISVQGFHVNGYIGTTGDPQQDGIELTLGVYKGASASLVSSGDIYTG
jgi:hypothetical protein